MFGKNATCPGSGCSTEMPSNRYSLVRGRPPLMRGSGAAGGGGSATPGTRPARVMKLRPLSGRSTTFLLSMTWPSPEVSLRSSGASAVTVTASVSAAELQLQVEPDASRPWRAECLRASAAGIRSTRPAPDTRRARAPERRSAPSASGHRRAGQVRSDRGHVTVAPGTAAPAWSTTSPARAPAPICAAEGRRGHPHTYQDPQARTCPTAGLRTSAPLGALRL